MEYKERGTHPLGQSVVKKKKKNSSGKVVSIKAVETNGYRLEDSSPASLNTQVTLIAFQQSADNQQHDFDDWASFWRRSFFHSTEMDRRVEMAT